MEISNVNTQGLETMQTKDALTFLNTLLSNKNFTKAAKVYTGLSSVITDKKFPKMDNVTLLVQTFGERKADEKYFILTQSRGNDCRTSNSIVVNEISQEDWRLEAHFIQRYNSLV